MNPIPDGDDRCLPLLDIIDLKWLLAREGVHLHVERLQGDPDYARNLLACAGGSANQALRQAAERLRLHLQQAGLTPVPLPQLTPTDGPAARA